MPTFGSAIRPFHGGRAVFSNASVEYSMRYGEVRATCGDFQACVRLEFLNNSISDAQFIAEFVKPSMMPLRMAAISSEDRVRSGAPTTMRNDTLFFPSETRFALVFADVFHGFGQLARKTADFEFQRSAIRALRRRSTGSKALVGKRRIGVYRAWAGASSWSRMRSMSRTAADPLL